MRHVASGEDRDAGVNRTRVKANHRHVEQSAIGEALRCSDDEHPHLRGDLIGKIAVELRELHSAGPRVGDRTSRWSENARGVRPVVVGS